MSNVKVVREEKGEVVKLYNEQGNLIKSYPIKIDKSGRKFYYVDNPKEKIGRFTDKIKDAFEVIKADAGDCLMHISTFAIGHFYVVRYIDREYGECVRKATLKNWKDTNFAYGVKFTLLDNMSGGSYVHMNDSLARIGWGFTNVKIFETEIDAQQYIDRVIETAESWYKEYLEIEKKYANDAEKEGKAIDCFLVKHSVGTANSIYWGVFGAMVDNKGYKLEAVQLVKGEKVGNNKEYMDV